MSSLVSIIIPAYNRKHLLRECLDAVLGQTYQPIEVIVIDDGSTDRTEEFIRTIYGTKVMYLRCEHSGLPAIARNVGIDHAQGSYIAFCDSDDVWLPHKITRQIERLNSNSCNCSCSDAFIADRDQPTVLSHYDFRYSDNIKNMLRDNFIITSSVVIERSLLLNYRFPTSPAFRAYEDYVLWLSLFETLRIDFINEPLLYYRNVSGNLSSSVGTNDAGVQMKILMTQKAYRKYPSVLVSKFIRSLIERAGLR